MSRRIKQKLLRPSDLPYICFYCGEPASDKEHVYPKSKFKNNTPIIWSCRECNSLASDKVFADMEDKRDYIHEAIRKRYKSVLELPNWLDEDINSLEYNLRVELTKVRASKAWLNKRLSWKTDIGVLIVLKKLQEQNTGKSFELSESEQTLIRESEARYCFTFEY